MYPPEFGKNPLFPQASDFVIELKNHVAGKGVKCLKRYKKGETIAQLAGEIVGAMREHSFQINSKKHLDDEYFIGYFLHSCDPNTMINTKELIATAVKKIEPGTFITIDYTATEDYLFRQFNCNCGSQHCRQVIAGKKESPRSALSLNLHFEDDMDD